MPEYLAPGVYVEETSFRSKSIEGVGTSTTAFVGPTLKGPVGVTPELITNFGDFERVYGGLGDIDGQTNYIAHAVNNFFDNGGSRLYVSRVQPSKAETGKSDDLLPDDQVVDVRFQARFPGAGGNGVIELFEKATQISRETLKSAPIGSVLRLGGDQVPQPARVEGTQSPPFNLPPDGKLLLTIDGANQEISFLGQPAEVGTAALPNSLGLAAPEKLVVRIGKQGIDQTLNLPAGNDVNALLTAINTQLRGGYARLDANRLTLGTDVRGLGAEIQVTSAPVAWALPSAPQSNITETANNNVSDLANVSLAELNGLLNPLRLDAVLVGGKLALQTRDTGKNHSLAIRSDPNNVFQRLGLAITTTASPAMGEDGRNPSYYVNNGSQGWQDQDDTQVDLTQQSFDQGFAAASIVTLNVISRTPDGVQTIYEDLGYSPNHPRWIGNVLAEKPTRRSEDLSNPVALSVVNGSVNALKLRGGLAKLATRKEPIRLSGGSSGGTPLVADYEEALKPLEALEEISILAAPGFSTLDDTVYRGIQQKLLTFVSRRRAYQILILDTPKNQEASGARAARSRIDSSYSALYYPWVVVANPLFRPGDTSQPAEIALPPSGFMAGIYGRNDTQRGVFKTPANEVVLGALRFERDINFAEQEVLNPLGINCLRFFPGRGYRVWGGRTASSDPEFKYVSVRRYFNFLEASIDRSTQWAVFEPNGERLWANIRETVTSFLYNEWVSGALLGESVQDAFFVRCDRSTITQNDLDNGRLICLIGVAVIKPAEFVIFRIGQKTVDGRN